MCFFLVLKRLPSEQICSSHRKISKLELLDANNKLCLSYSDDTPFDCKVPLKFFSGTEPHDLELK